MSSVGTHREHSQRARQQKQPLNTSSPSFPLFVCEQTYGKTCPKTPMAATMNKTTKSPEMTWGDACDALQKMKLLNGSNQTLQDSDRTNVRRLQQASTQNRAHTQHHISRRSLSLSPSPSPSLPCPSL